MDMPPFPVSSSTNTHHPPGHPAFPNPIESTHTSVATDDTQSVFMAGVTDGAVGASAQNSGHSDGFLIKISPDGDVLWTRQFDNGDQQDFVQSASADRYEGPGTHLPTVASPPSAEASTDHSSWPLESYL